nr:MAG TPA: prohead serine protease [Caudoviricetes sp.]
MRKSQLVMALQYKSHAGGIEVKSKQDDGTLSIRAYALAFGNIDSYGDIIKAGACDKWLRSEDSKRCALCYQHDIRNVIGVITEKGVDDKGLWIEADILPTQQGKDVQILMQAGAIKEFSIGYYADTYTYGKEDGQDVRYLEEISIVEVSPVTRAANPLATLTDMKEEDMAGSLAAMPEAQLSSLHDAVEEEIAKRIISKL